MKTSAFLAAYFFAVVLIAFSLMFMDSFQQGITGLSVDDEVAGALDDINPLDDFQNVNALLESTPPVITIDYINNQSYTPGQTFVISSTAPSVNAMINVSVDKSSICKISSQNLSYDLMTTACNDPESLTKACFYLLNEQKDYTLFIACNDTLGNFNTNKTSKTAALRFQQVMPESEYPNIEVKFFDTDQPDIGKKVYHSTKLNHEIVLASSIISCRIARNTSSYNNMKSSCTPEYPSSSPIYCRYNETEDSRFNASKPNGSYYLLIACKNRANNANYTMVNYTINISVPETIILNISELKASSVTNQSASIEWKTTKFASALVFYGRNETKLNQSRGNVSLSFKMSHAIEINNLAPLTMYFYKTKNCDASNDCIESDVMNFTTTKTPEDETPPIILNVQLKAGTATADNETINDGTIKVSWDTDELSNCTFLYGKNSSDLATAIKWTNMSLTFLVNLSDADRETYYKIICSDARNNTRTSKLFNMSEDIACIPDFECSNWSGCEDGVKMRHCRDKNECAAIKIEREVCGSTSEYAGFLADEEDSGAETAEQDIEQPTEIADDQSHLGTIFLIILAVLVSATGGSYFLYKQGKLPQLAPLFSKIDSLASTYKKVDLPKMAEIDPLYSYIDQMRKAGYSDDMVYHNLIKHGYRPDQINKYFRI